jgi:transcriptional regulator with XRE-family HTH domain
MPLVNAKAYRISERRKALGWSMRKLALAAGMRPETVARLEQENHLHGPRMATALLLDRILADAERAASYD